MRNRSFIAVAVTVFALLAGAVVVYAYDSSREERIANGVTVAGVDVGGLEAAEARDVVRRSVAQQVERPIRVVHRKKRFNLSAKDARIRADVGGMVDDALAASRDGNIVGRVVRDVTGGEEDAAVPARITYSAKAVTKLVRRVTRNLDRPAQDATLDFPALTKVKERDGVKVLRGRLELAVEDALQGVGSARTARVPVKVTKPKVTRNELAQKWPNLLVVNRGAFTLSHYRDLKLVKSYTVAIGALGFDTPAGLYHIQNKAVNPAWSVPNSAWAGELAGTVVPGGVPDNPLKSRWMGIFDGAGIHGTDQTYSLGTAASHGCVRMGIPDVEELYDRVDVGTPIYIG